VKEGVFSFSKRSHDVRSVIEIEMADNMLSVAIADTVLNDSSRTAGNDTDKLIDELPKKAHAEGGSEIEVVRPARDDQDTESDAIRKGEEEHKAMKQALQALEAEKLKMAQELRELSTLLHNSAAAASGGASDHRSPTPDTVQLAICQCFLFLIFFEQVSLLR
jgi:hypothetical protein